MKNSIESVLNELLKYKQTKTAKQLINETLLELDKQRKLDGIERINNDVNGNPRFVCHFLSFITSAESDELWRQDRTGEIRSAITAQYELALEKSRCIGGRKFHNKQYGSGIVFQVYSKEELLNLIEEVLNGTRKC